MSHLAQLIEISRYYGRNPAYVIAGGGNTSFKDRDRIYVKASGISLAGIDESGFVVLSRALLGEMEERLYPEDASSRELAVKQDLKKAVLGSGHLRPSVETSLHNLIDYPFVVHTHPTWINALMCAVDAEKETRERFGADALYVAYTDPGFVLFKKLQEEIRAWQAERGESPKIIFLQNHGIFVAGNSTAEIRALYTSLESRIWEGKSRQLPDDALSARDTRLSKFIQNYYRERGLQAMALSSELSRYYCRDKSRMEQVARPFTPDQIVYCKSNYLFLPGTIAEKACGDELAAFEKRRGHYPRLILEEGGALIVVEENVRGLQIVAAVFSDAMKLSYLSAQFGGPHSMTGDQIAFIDNWEVENYRRKIAKA
ncbi:MAG: alcohol dehydrogenase [Bacteroidetes bacterium]|nr:MAG: alcohol dehydrogenase [Bacteroidota bacterium]